MDDWEDIGNSIMTLLRVAYWLVVFLLTLVLGGFIYLLIR